MLEPLVSIIIPVYNGSNYVREAIDSALAQTYQNIEVIVVNDGSRDDGETDRIVREYGDRIRYYVKENGGVSSALNVGIREMTGEYFSWLSHDDAYMPDKIEKQVVALNQCESPENTLIYCGHSCMDEHSRPISTRRIPVPFAFNKIYSSFEVLTSLLKKSTFNGCCLLIPRKALLACGLFNEKLRFCQDAFMWYDIFMKDYSLFCIEDACVKNRIHAGQLTQKGQALFRKECNEMSEVLANDLFQRSTQENNYLRLYLLSDARYFTYKRVKRILALGRKKKLFSLASACKAYLICTYGKVRPFIRILYYKLFRNMNTK